MTEIEIIVQQQVEAYNRNDIEAFLAFYSEDIIIRNNAEVVIDSYSEFSLFYRDMFNKYPNKKATIKQRLVHGSFVVDHEAVTGRSEEDDLEALAVYKVTDGKIVEVDFKI